MGFIDHLDNALTNAIHRGDGRRFAETVIPGKPYYTIKTANYSFGNVRYLDVTVFTNRRGLISGTIDGAEGLYNCNGGKVYTDRNCVECRGLPTLAEYSASGSAEELVTGGNLNDYAAKHRRRAA
jgi:hypothetical protein